MVELDLSDNLIELRDDLFSSLGKHLEVLKLDKNNIGSLPRFAFSGLEKLDSLSLRENKISCISNDTFASKELGNLKKLDIYGNELSEIGAGTLELFPKLEFLNIMDNRINCNCLFKETAQYLKNHKVKKCSQNFQDTFYTYIIILSADLKLNLFQNSISLASPRCSRPANIGNFAILDLPSQLFKCEPEDASHVQCRSVSTCPRGCSCVPKDSWVDCASRKLKTVDVENIPISTRNLDLQDNDLSKVPDLSKLVHLEFLDLSNNRLPGIAPQAFKLPNLRRLMLANNQIKCITENSFDGIPKLEMLTLNDNRIRRIPEKALPKEALQSISRISISGIVLTSQPSLDTLL